MSPKIYNMTPTRRRKIRRAALAALFAMMPTPVEAVIHFAVGRVASVGSKAMGGRTEGVASEAAASESVSDPIVRVEPPMRKANGATVTTPVTVPVVTIPSFSPASRSTNIVDYDITTTDAEISCFNPHRGTTIHFKVETITTGNLAGKRIVSVLVDGYRWEGFGFVDDFGVSVWSKKRGDSLPFGRYGSFLENLSAAQSKGVTLEITWMD